MATANVVELEACIEDCIRYCAEHPEQDFVEHFEPRLRNARRKYEEAVTRSDRQFLEWKGEGIEEKLAWKHLAKELKATQMMLRRVNAIGFPERRVLHWDTEILTDAVEEMVGYLEERTDAIEGASGQVDKLQRLLTLAAGEDRDEDQALDEYNRHVLFRSSALGGLASTLGEFRKSMRRRLGKHHADYRSIRWPITLSPDQPVL